MWRNTSVRSSSAGVSARRAPAICVVSVNVVDGGVLSFFLFFFSPHESKLTELRDIALLHGCVCACELMAAEALHFSSPRCSNW